MYGRFNRACNKCLNAVDVYFTVFFDISRKSRVDQHSSAFCICHYDTIIVAEYAVFDLVF